MLNDQEALELARISHVVAVVGMTDGSKPGRASYDIPLMLLRRGYRLIPINPMLTTALGLPCLSSVAQMPPGVEVLNVFRRPEVIPALADELCALPLAQRPKAVWLQTGIRHLEAESKLEKAGFQVVADKCLGVLAARVRKVVE